MRNRTIGITSGLITLVSLGIAVGLNLTVGRWSAEGVTPGWVPVVETVGTTIVFADAIVNVLMVGVPLGLALGFGYYLGSRVDVASMYTSLLKVVSVGSTLGVFLGWSVLFTQGMSTSSPWSFGSVLVTAGLLLGYWMDFAFTVVLGIFAGATFAHFRTRDQPPAHPTEATPDAQSAQETESETTELNSQPTR